MPERVGHNAHSELYGASWTWLASLSFHYVPITVAPHKPPSHTCCASIRRRVPPHAPALESRADAQPPSDPVTDRRLDKSPVQSAPGNGKRARAVAKARGGIDRA